MAGGQERILRRRIRSVQSTKKITRAMELIAASRIVKAQARVHAAQPYSDKITEVVQDLAAAGAGTDSPLLAPRPEIHRVAHVIVTADRGLCGAYNSSVLRAAEGSIREQAELGRDYALFVRRAQGRGLLPVPQLPDRRRVHRVLRQPDLRGRPGDRRGRRAARSSPAKSTWSSSSTRASSPPGSRRSCVRR